MIKTLVRNCLIAIAICGASTAWAQPVRQPEVVPYKCKITPSIRVNFPPNETIGKTNNLWRMTGLAIPAVGKPVFIHGIVLDEHCVPVQGTVVQIWQADAKGNYALDDKGSKDLDPYFGASGTALTDNRGEYNFLTIFPGTVEGEAPYIRFRVKHQDFKTIRTKMFFEGSPNEKDEDYKALSKSKRGVVTATSDPDGLSPHPGSKSYFFNIVLKGKVPYKQY